ncbi:WbqC family protein [Bacillus sp. DTU_2020_1000418_1_SI_GHA_SEK_038]|uniref:WbqC family protein n=1 Tax=Bacillus sp. DTU_2020_1000418_1_SI_GHA_SEK_038 TaxID=3077585 RepID=UPI0028E6E7A6|nr:WbqC family protein [Bacillus sp. DTU_2020_1000418_1_SI_GHA_SEK_038]WNS74817.1 WbqC family protein [Bacillus sp. DTU_2020_1000418_1_SI_GHA_SEK_038]
MIVTVHQPNLFPWLGFFDKMAKADLFIFLDNVQFTKRGYQNRVKVKSPHGGQWLTVPVISKGRAYQITNEVEIDNSREWKKDHLVTLELLYRGTKNFDDVFKQLHDLYQDDADRLIDFTTKGIHLIQENLSIKTKTIYGSSLNAEGSNSQLITNLVKEVGGTVYLSGPSGRNYLDEQIFQNENVKVEYHEFQEEIYPQKYNDFVGGLSTLDYMFNV